MITPFKIPNSDYKRSVMPVLLITYRANTDKGWVLLAELLLNHCYWN